MARSVERDRRRFLEKLMVAPSAWSMARTLARRVGDEGGEGLRGIYDLADGSLVWWVASGTSHHQARLMLGKERDADVVEVEINVGRDGTLYPCWPRNEPEDRAQAFLSHPTIRHLVEGCLSVNGRQIQIRGGTVRLLRQPAGPQDHAVDRRKARRELWKGMLDEAEGWVRLRRSILPDGRPRPPMGTLTPYRAFLKEAEWFGIPVPEAAMDGTAMVLTWRKTGSVATMRFEDGIVQMRVNDDGRVKVWEPKKWRRQRDVDFFSFDACAGGFRSKGE